MFEIRHYLTVEGRDIFDGWRGKLGDVRGSVAVDRRMIRMEQGNFGDHKFCRDGVWELRIDVGAGYRIYYAIAGTKLILLLSGGDKSSQSRDIKQACAYWRDWQQRGDA